MAVIVVVTVAHEETASVVKAKVTTPCFGDGLAQKGGAGRGGCIGAGCGVSGGELGRVGCGGCCWRLRCDGGREG